ncbi:hypothetical protein [Paraburkholderia dinghuensis]|uniref:Uncharacterized protein n=1 Tax=Paraburkholderia dinghuensis TaxID=2305225 RepID=A0A3N6MD25_9BURK|nr:hypothetical protein [Paraburkholderia dinghuensis]RQH00628.1 hypothetical protein D1Y85_24910 [Paraburkholderia dinghuensis]
MADNADNDLLSPSRAARRGPSKRRTSSAARDTENKPARTAQSTQAFAQPGEPLRDETTLDLFAADPLHAPVQVTGTGDRTGVSDSFELQEQERQAVEASQVTATTDGAEALVAVSHISVQAEAATAVAAGAATDTALRDDANGSVASEVAAALESAATASVGSEITADAVVPVTDRPQAPTLAEGSAAAEVVFQDAAATQVNEAATEPMLPGQALAQLRSNRTVAAPRPAKGRRTVSREADADSAATDDAPSAGPEQPAEPANASRAEASPASDRPVPSFRYAGDFTRAGMVAESAVADATTSAARLVPPEMDPARAAAFAEAIDALNGVIADQRRAAAELSRRMRWMLGAVVGALLVTVAAGVAQTLIVSRLATDASAQQQRLAQMMQDQQAVIANALARLPSQAEAPAAQVASQSTARPVATSPAHHTQRAATHVHHAHTASQ